MSIIDDAELVGPSPIVCLLPHITRCDLNDLPYCTTASAAQRVGEDKRSHTTHFHRTEILHMSRSEPRRMKHKSGNRWRCGAVKLHACAFCSPQQINLQVCTPLQHPTPHDLHKTRQCVTVFHYRTVDRSSNRPKKNKFDLYKIIPC